VPQAGDALQFIENIAAVVEADLPNNGQPPAEGELLSALASIPATDPARLPHSR